MCITRSIAEFKELGERQECDLGLLIGESDLDAKSGIRFRLWLRHKGHVWRSGCRKTAL